MSLATVELVAVSSGETRMAAVRLVNEYLSWVADVALSEYGLHFDVEGMARSDIEDGSKFFPPAGRFYVIRYAGDYVGVGALKQLSSGTCELQRMYVQPRARGVGAGRRLLERLLADARSLGYGVVRLESLKALGPAHALYRSAGFREIQPYVENSMSDYQPSNELARYRDSAIFMELTLSRRTAGDA